MEKAKKARMFMLALGISLCLLALINAMPFTADSGIWDQIYRIRLVRKYTFFGTGVAILVSSYVLGKVVEDFDDELMDLYGRVSKLEGK